MSDALQIFKEKQINDYLSSIDMTDINIEQVKKDLKTKLGEEPAIKFNYINEQIIKEGTSEKVRVEKLQSVTIIFTVEREIVPGFSSPFPVSQTFIVG